MYVRSPLVLRAALAGVALCLSAGTARAQQALAPLAPRADVSLRTPARDAAPAADSARVGPTVDAARVAASEPRSHELIVTSAAPRRGLGQPIALMVVGGAALLTGLIIGDDAGTVIAVSGALVGLYGLYEYLQ
jgi:hypothetical protein